MLYYYYDYDGHFTHTRTKTESSSLPALGEHLGDGIVEDFPLVGDVLHDVSRPAHEVTDLVGGRGPVHVPFQLLLHLLTQHALWEQQQVARAEF